MQNNITLLEWAQNCFAHDLFATETTGITIEKVDSQTSICTLQISERHRNARGAVMGGVFFTLADFASAIAMNSNEALSRIAITTNSKELYTLHWVTLQSSINFLSQPKGNVLTAATRCVRQGHSTCLFEVTILDGTRIIATVTSNGIRI